MARVTTRALKHNDHSPFKNNLKREGEEEERDKIKDRKGEGCGPLLNLFLRYATV